MISSRCERPRPRGAAAAVAEIVWMILARPRGAVCALLAAVSLAATPPGADAAVELTAATLDFNAFGTNTAGVHMPATHGGFLWGATDWHYLSIDAVPTNTFLALSGAATMIASEGGRDFYFDGARFWSRGGEPQGRFYFYLLRDGAVVYDGRNDAAGRQVFSPAHDVFTANYTDKVDAVAVVFDSNGADWNHLALDDFHARFITVVPDPPLFTEIDPGLPSSTRNAMAWADYDGDGRMDVFIGASGSKGTAITRIYRNTGAGFVDSGLTGFTAIEEGAAAWGDCDNDGDPDLAVMGRTPGGATSLRVYRNNRTNFTAIAGNFLNVYAGDLGWADVDGDGDEDLLVSGVTAAAAGSPCFTKLYRNDRTNFVSIAHPFPNVYLGAVAWADYDNDGDPDLLLAGTGSADLPDADIFRNDGGTFTNLHAAIPLQDIGGVDWGDYDHDGDLDLLVTGQGSQGFVSSVLRNDGGAFTDIGAGVTGLIWSACSWGDCDGDGDLDAAFAGYDAATAASYTRIYRNEHGQFIDTGASTHGMYLGTMDWVDVDGDGRLELCVAGAEANVGGTSFLLYRNARAFTNTPPLAPSNLVATLDGESVVLSWSAAADAQTPAAGLAYRVRVGSTSGASDVLSAVAVASNGVRGLSGLANASLSLRLPAAGLTVGSHYVWSVQAVDASWAGGAFAAESAFTAQNAPLEAVAAAPDPVAGPMLTFEGSPRGMYLIESSPDCVTWTVVGPATADDAGRVVVAAGTGADRAFFRTVRP